MVSAIHCNNKDVTDIRVHKEKREFPFDQVELMIEAGESLGE